MLSFHGEVAVVTGAANGLGAATSRAFARAGASVVMLDVDVDGLETIRAEIDTEGGTAHVIPTDVSRAVDVDAAIERCLELTSRIDVLVNNAGIGRGGWLHEFTEEAWDAVIDTNLKSMYLTCRRVIPVMQHRGAGAIVNVSSVQAYWSVAGMAAYSASKAGVVGFTRALALDLAQHGIRVVAIAPSTMNTPMVHNALRNNPNSESLLAVVADRHPVKRILDPAEVADVILFLASSHAGGVTGITVPVDGGILSGTEAW